MSNIDDLKLLHAALEEALHAGERMSEVLEVAQKSLIQAGELVELSIRLTTKILIDASKK